MKSESQPLLIPKKAISLEDDDSEPSGDVTTKTILEEALDILKLGIPIFIASVSWVGVRKTVSAPIH
jgi:hypothetical protein